MSVARGAALADLIAGVSIAGLVLPEAVAYSGLANLPPQAGVIALFAGLLSYGLLGRSRVAVVTATSSSAAVLASAMLTLGATDLTQRLVLASVLVTGAGVAFVLASALRLGALSHLIARPVLRGYAFGLALVIAGKQLPQLLSLHAHHTEFFPLVAEVLRAHSAWHGPSLACGLIALGGLFALGRVPRVPAAFAVIVASIAASSWLEAQGVALTGPIQLTPQMPSLARPQTTQWLALAEFSLALMLIVFAESYGSIRSLALKGDEEVQPNRDLLALGVANIACGVLNATPVGAGYSASSANAAAGAHSRAAGLWAAGVSLALILFFLGWIERIPQPVLAAIVIHALSRSVRWGVFTDYFRWQRDRLLVVAAVLAVMVLGVLNGLLAAIALSLALLLKSLATPRLSELGRLGEHDYVSVARFSGAKTVTGMLVLRPEQPLFFANAEPLFALARQRVMDQPHARLVILSLEESPDLDGTTLEALRDFGAWLASRGTEFRVARLKDRAREALLRARLAPLPRAALDYSSVDDAVRGDAVRG